jgi:hypothetical protein
MRYTLAFPIRYRVVPRNGPPLTGRGTTCDISSAGLSFLCREALPMGSHIAMARECGRALPPGLEDDGIRGPE